MVKRSRSSTRSVSRGRVGRSAMRTPSTGRRPAVKRRASSTPLRRLSFSSASTKGTNRLVGHSAHSGESAVSTRLPIAHTKFVKRVNYKKKKKVKVSKLLKAKIKSVLDKGHAHGEYKEFYYNIIYNTNSNQQVVKPLLPFNTQNVAGIHFDPCRVLNAASILWNNKRTVVDMKQPTITQADTFEGATGNLSGFKLLARDLHSRITLRNNSQRVYICKIYECAPKSTFPPGFDVEASVDWTNSLATEALDAVDAGIGIASVNPLKNVKEDLYMTPYACKAFMNMYAVQCTNVTIEPGQTYVYFMQGPKDMVYDYTKYYESSTYVNAQKMCRKLFIEAHNDLVSGTDTGALGGANPAVARIAEGTGFKGAGLAVEIENIYKLGIPKMAGWYNPAAGPIASKGQQLDFQHDVHAQNVFPFVGFSPTTQPIRFDEENPVVTVIPV